MKTILALTCIAVLATSTALLMAQARSSQLEPVTDPNKAYEMLMEGHRKFLESNDDANGRGQAARSETASSQKPYAIIIACSDSRVNPKILFNKGIGDIFVIQIAGNTLTDYGLASIEYAVAVLGSPLIYVLGHENCGAVDAAVKQVEDGTDFPGHIDLLVNKIAPAVRIVQQEEDNEKIELADAVEENVRYVMKKVKNSAPIVAQAVQSGKVQVRGGVYHLEDGSIEAVEIDD